ncbi:ATP-grasp domain-containing protein [Streptomyces sp. BA2]|uniref:ATP-grasp domain-containing protein n=1 Tax=Streptomyces sp. BA2 TaxID=436595 RepID=UPI001327FA6B|nr:RimK family alpha-L-glutamate ligase [Streptomyces sp. BA2]MWA08347.1 RimK family alpha-L-glutamate ligase [Streptomyces sp. BA2]
MRQTVAVAADRIGWEERRLIAAAPAFGLHLSWVNDESMCLGHPAAPSLAGYDALLVRSRSYTRGGLLATLAEAAAVHTLNTARAISICQNKAVLRTVLRSEGIPVPDFRLVLSRRDFERCVQELTLPLVLKPIFGGMGKRVTLLRHADTAASVYDYIEDLGHAFEQACLVEPYAGDTSVRCLVAGDELLGAVEFTGDGTDWRSNAALGNRTRPMAHDPDLRKILDGVVSALGPGIYGVDLFRTPDGYMVNEVNHAPAFRALDEAVEADIPTAVARHIREALA